MIINWYIKDNFDKFIDDKEIIHNDEEALEKIIEEVN